MVFSIVMLRKNDLIQLQRALNVHAITSKFRGTVNYRCKIKPRGIRIRCTFAVIKVCHKVEVYSQY